MRDVPITKIGAPSSSRPLPRLGWGTLLKRGVGVQGLANRLVGAGHVAEQLQTLIKKAFFFWAVVGTIVDQTGVRQEPAAVAQLALAMPQVEDLGRATQGAIGLYGPSNVMAAVLKSLQPTGPGQANEH